MKVTDKHVYTLELDAFEIKALRAMLHSETFRKIETRLTAAQNDFPSLDVSHGCTFLMQLKDTIAEL